MEENQSHLLDEALSLNFAGDGGRRESGGEGTDAGGAGEGVCFVGRHLRGSLAQQQVPLENSGALSDHLSGRSADN
jgi:hypothetical protein